MKWLAAFRTNIAVVWTIASFEVRTDVRLLRTWVFVAFALLVGVSNAIGQIDVFTQLSAVSSGTFIHSPLLSPATIFPDFQVIITFGLVFFAIEITSRDQRARIDEVIGALPISNNQLVLGRAFGLSALLYVLFAAFLCLYVGAAYFCDVALPNLGFQPPETYSMLATLFTDALPYMYFWTAVVMFLTVVVRFRVLAAVLAIAFMLSMYWLQNNAPMYLLNVLGTYSLSTQLPSELSPVFTTTAIVYQRIALVVLATALLLWTAYLLPRLDSDRTRTPALLAVSASVLAVLGFSFVQAQTSSRMDELAGWRERHAQIESAPQVDIERLSGQVQLDPGANVAIDLTIDFNLVLGLQREDSVVFSLNPGYEIEDIAIDGVTVAYSFDRGLLTVSLPRQFEDGERLSLTIRASGRPNTRFAYLDTVIDPLSTDAVSGYGLYLLGSEKAINHSDYVALVPGIAWYPMAGPHLDRDAISRRPRDYFNVTLDVLTPHEWYVGGPGGGVVKDLSHWRSHTFTPSIPIHEVGLFAAEFERRQRTIAGIDFELLISPKHTRNLDLFEPILEEVEADIEERIEFARTRGFEFPFDTYTIVETPVYLRTYGGGWEMPSIQSLPGVFLLREGMFLSADFQAVANTIQQDVELTDEEKSQRLRTYLTRYFENDVTGGNISHAFVDNYVRFRSEPTGPRAEWLGFLIHYLASEVASQSSGFFSVQNLKTIGTWLTARLGAWDIDAERTQNTLNQIYFNQYIDRPEVWEFMLEDPANEDSTTRSPRNRLHAGFLYSQTMGDLILDWFGRERVGLLLATLTERFEGTSYTYEDVNSVAAELGMPLQEIFGDWLNDIRPAGFIASAYKVVRLPDDSDGTPVYEHTFHVQNPEPNAGLFSVWYEFGGEATDTEHVARTSRPIQLNGQSSVQIAIQVKAPIETMEIHPYFSLNRAEFEVDSARDRSIPTVLRAPAPLVRPSDWVWDFNDKIYVDDLDPGFSVDPRSTHRDSRFTIRMISLNQPDPELISTDQGLKIFDTFGVASTNEWTRQAVDTSFGAYRRTLARVEHASSPQRVHFNTDLPHAGKWVLSYHLPDVGAPNDNVFGNRGQYGLDLGEVNTWGDFDITVTQHDRSQRTEMLGEDMEVGWNRIGTFELSAEDVSVIVSTHSSHGTVVADAIFWERLSIK